MLFSGTYQRTIWRNERTGEARFTVSNIQDCGETPPMQDNIVTCFGVIGLYAPGAPIEIEGYAHGDEIKVTQDRIPRNTPGHAILLVRHVTDNLLTEKQEREIVALSKGDLLHYCATDNAEEEIRKALSQREDGNSLARKIVNKLLNLRRQEELTNYLLRFDFPLDKIELLYKNGVTKEQIIRNPYQICLAHDIPITKADALAVDAHVYNQYGMQRMTGFIRDAMKQSARNGNTCVQFNDLCRAIYPRSRMLGVEPITMTPSVLAMCLGEVGPPIEMLECNNVPYLYNRRILEEEDAALYHIQRLQNARHEYVQNVDLDSIQKKLNIQYNEGQRKAFNLLKTSGIKVLTGPPGSGKTAVIRGIIECFKANGFDGIQLAATTGRAAQIMADACQEEASTIHIMLDIRPFDDEACGRDMNNPLDGNLIIVDEVSMISLKLFAQLLGAVKSGAILLLVGDKDQLQSVEYGDVLHGLLSSERIESCRLTEIMRQSGTIPHNAALINQGDVMLEEDDSFTYTQYRDAKSLLEALDRNYTAEGAQVLSPTKGGELGIHELNRHFQLRAFGQESSEPFVTYGKRTFYRGDKIIMTKTEYSRGYCNGEIGSVTDIRHGDVVASFNGRTITLTRQDLANTDLAYAITIHKSQGSEADTIHIVLPDDAGGMMSRRLLYTAVTRARKRVFIYYIGSSFNNAIGNVFEHPRISLLAERLRQNAG